MRYKRIKTSIKLKKENHYMSEKFSIHIEIIKKNHGTNDTIKF